MFKLFGKSKISAKVALLAAASWPLFALVYFSSYWLRFEGDLDGPELRLFLSTFAWVACLKVAFVQLLPGLPGLGKVRHVPRSDAAAQGRHRQFVCHSADGLPALPRLVDAAASVFLMDWGLTIVIVGGLRSLARLLEERESSGCSRKASTPVFIVGANDSGEALLRAIRRNPRLPYRVVGLHRRRSARPWTRTSAACR